MDIDGGINKQRAEIEMRKSIYYIQYFIVIANHCRAKAEYECAKVSESSLAALSIWDLFKA
jgi:hypothetical protein